VDESPRGDVRGRRVSDPSGPSTTKTCQHFSKTCTDRQRSLVAAMMTASAAPAERNMPGRVPLRQKPIARRAEVYTDPLGPRVWVRLPPTAG
jgi:hypothetical protein